MRLFLILFIASSAVVDIVYGNCDSCINEQCYNKHLLPGTSGNAGDIDRYTNTLYITKPNRIKRCHLDSSQCKEYRAYNIGKIVVDQSTGDVYGSIYLKKAIYKFDLDNNEKSIVAGNVQTLDIQFHRALYYASGNGGIYKVMTDGRSQLVPGTRPYRIKRFVVDINSDIYFAYDKYGESRTKRVSEGKVNETYFANITYLTLDRDGNVMFVTEESLNYNAKLYRLKDHVEIGVINDWSYGTPLFDRDNNIVYTSSALEPHYHLKRESGVKCIVQNNKITETTGKNEETSTYETSTEDNSGLFTENTYYYTESTSTSPSYETGTEDGSTYEDIATYTTEPTSTSPSYEATTEYGSTLYDDVATYTTESTSTTPSYETGTEDGSTYYDIATYTTEPTSTSPPYEATTEYGSTLYDDVATYTTESTSTTPSYETGTEDGSTYEDIVTYTAESTSTSAPYEATTEYGSTYYDDIATYTTESTSTTPSYETGTDDGSTYEDIVTYTAESTSTSAPYEVTTEYGSTLYDDIYTSYTTKSITTCTPDGNKDKKCEENVKQTCKCEKLPNINIKIDFVSTTTSSPDESVTGDSMPLCSFTTTYRESTTSSSSKSNGHGTSKENENQDCKCKKKLPKISVNVHFD